MMEKCDEVTAWASHGLFVEKHHKEGERIKVRLVADFQEVKKILISPSYPMKPLDKYLSTIDLLSGYHQIFLPEENHNMFCIVLTQEEIRYCRLLQGSSPISDIFYLSTDGEIGNRRFFKKNMDDVLTGL